MKKSTITVNETTNMSEPNTSKEETIIKKNYKTTVVYVGPTIKNVVSKNIMYNNGIPDYLNEEIKKQPLINNLIVPIEKLSTARNELRNPKSALSIVYGKINTREE